MNNHPALFIALGVGLAIAGLLFSEGYTPLMGVLGSLP
jgi:hypothetical protein